MKKEIYAYLEFEKINGEFKIIKKETLKEHIQTGLDIIDKISESRFSRILDNKDIFWLKFAWRLHDVGKIFYQGNLRREEENRYKISFFGHELFSTYIASKILNYWVSSDLEENIEEYGEYRDIILASILYHHHAMNLRYRMTLNEPKMFFRDPEMNFELGFKNLDDLRNSVLEVYKESEIIEEYIWPAIKTLLQEERRLYISEVVISDLRRYINEINRSIWRNFVAGGPEFRKKFLCFVMIILTCDYPTAMKNRGLNGKTLFGKVIEDFARIYGIIN